MSATLEMAKVFCRYLTLILMASTAHFCFAQDACARYNVKQTSRILREAIDLNSKFKDSLNSKDANRYQALRSQLEKKSETEFVPCLEHAAAPTVEGTSEINASTLGFCSVIRKFSGRNDFVLAGDGICESTRESWSSDI